VRGSDASGSGDISPTPGQAWQPLWLLLQFTRAEAIVVGEIARQESAGAATKQLPADQEKGANLLVWLRERRN